MSQKLIDKGKWVGYRLQLNRRKKTAKEKGIQAENGGATCKLRGGLEQPKSLSPTGKILPELGLQPREISKGTQTTLPWAEGSHSGRNRTWAWPTGLGGLSLQLVT